MCATWSIRLKGWSVPLQATLWTRPALFWWRVASGCSLCVSCTQVLEMFGGTVPALLATINSRRTVLGSGLQRQFSCTSHEREVGYSFNSLFSELILRFGTTTIHYSLRQAAMILLKRNPICCLWVLRYNFVLTFPFNFNFQFLSFSLKILYQTATTAALIQDRHNTDDSEGWDILAEKAEKWDDMSRRAGTCYPPQMVNQTPLITSE